MKELHLIDIYEKALPRDAFLQHIAEMHHISFESHTDVTLRMLEDKLNDHFDAREAAQKAAQKAVDEFISLQRTNGLSDESIVIHSSEDRIVVHFDLREVKNV